MARRSFRNGNTPTTFDKGLVDHYAVPISVAGRLQDTRRENETQFQEEKYRMLVEDMPALVCRFRPEGILTFVNENYCRYFGKKREELEGTDFFQLIPVEERERVYQHYRSLTPAQPTLTYEHRVLTPGGMLRWQRWTDRALFDDRGRPVEYQSLGEDITERVESVQALLIAKEQAEAARHKEEQRRQEAERRRDIADGLGEIVTALNSDEPLLEVLRQIARKAQLLLGSQAVTICNLEQKEGFPIQVAVGLPNDKACLEDLGVNVLAIEQAMTHHQIIILPDPAKPSSREDHSASNRERGFGASAALGYRTLLAVPIMIRVNVRGGFVFLYEQPHSFTTGDVELVTVLSHQIALAVESAQMREELEQAAASAERSRLARDLHDAVTQTLFSACITAEALSHVWERNPEEGKRALDELVLLNRGALAEMRALLLQLRPAGIVEKPLGVIVQQLVNAVSSRTRVPIQFEVQADDLLLADVQIALYRIVQEALSNARRHAGATRVDLGIAFEGDHTRITIADNGRGFKVPDKVEDLASYGKLGLVGMKERAYLIGGTLTIASEEDKGTTITVDLPAS